ncbi:MAG: rhodanese-like domain-containing protein [Thermodesulfobacteriota bacterium]
MKKHFVFTTMCVLLLCSGFAFALTSEELKAVQKASDEFLRNVPEDGYHIPAEEVMAKIKSGAKDFLIVDVRMPKDKKYDKGHLPGAIYIGFRELAKPENLANLPKDKDIIVHCDTGHEQNKALSVLRMLGYKAFDLKWGYMAWKPLPPTSATLKAIQGSIGNDYPVEK